MVSDGRKLAELTTILKLRSTIPGFTPKDVLNQIYEQEFYKGHAKGVAQSGQFYSDNGELYRIDTLCCGEYEDGLILLGSAGRECTFIDCLGKLCTRSCFLCDVQRGYAKFTPFERELQRSIHPAQNIQQEPSHPVQNIQEVGEVYFFLNFEIYLFLRLQSFIFEHAATLTIKGQKNELRAQNPPSTRCIQLASI